jgi:hypothetical protein
MKIRMCEITFPFCVVLARQSGMTLPLAPSQGYLAAFSTIEKAAAYMCRRGDTDWKMTLVSRPTLEMTVESLQSLGARGLAFDPEQERLGTLIDFEKLRQM